MVQNLPEAQLLQLELPLASWYEPDPHSTQLDDFAEEYLPNAQGVQLAAPAEGVNVPETQSTHEAAFEPVVGK